MQEYTQKEKEIFRYFDGKKHRWADPVAIRRRMATALAAESMADVLDRCNDPDRAIADQAKDAILMAIRVAFEMPCYPDAKEVDGYGATDNECIEAINAYIDFNKKKGGSFAQSQTLPEHTTSAHLAQNDCPTKSSMVCG